MSILDTDGEPREHPSPGRGRPRKALLYGSLALTAAALSYAGVVIAGLPDRAAVRRLADGNPAQTSLMIERDQQAQREGRAAGRVQRWIPLERMSHHLLHAAVAAEDAGFFDHSGVDWHAVKESVETNLRRGAFARGGSTLTQQLAKNLFFTTRKSLTRKLRELVVTLWLERDLSKRRILELYLNVIEWGDGIYGCEAAARRYYGLRCAALGPGEAAGLAAMIPSPRRLNPVVDPERHERARQRILRLMKQARYVSSRVRQLAGDAPQSSSRGTP